MRIPSNRLLNVWGCGVAVHKSSKTMNLQAFLESSSWRTQPEQLYLQMVDHQVIRRPEGWYFTSGP